MINKYRKLPVVIEAAQWDGSSETYITIRDWSMAGVAGNRPIKLSADGSMTIETLEGVMQANLNDFIIRGVNGEFYPCKPDIFRKTYEIVEDE